MEGKEIKLFVNQVDLDTIEKFLFSKRSIDISNYPVRELKGFNNNGSIKGLSSQFFARLWNLQEEFLKPEHTAFYQAQGFINIWGLITQEILGADWYRANIKMLEQAFITDLPAPDYSQLEHGRIAMPVPIIFKPGIYQVSTGGHFEFLRDKELPTDFLSPGFYQVHNTGVIERLKGTVITSDSPAKPAPAPEPVKTEPESLDPEIWESTADVYIDVSCYLCRRYESLRVKEVSDFILNLQAGPGFKKWQVVEMAGGRSVLVCGKCPGSKKILEKEPFTDEEAN